MSKGLKLVEQVLLGNIVAYEGKIKIKEVLSSYKYISMREYSRHTCLLRLCRSIVEGNWMDAAGHLRQIILTFKQRFKLAEMFVEKFRPFLTKFRLLIDDLNEVDTIGGYPSWINHNEYMDKVYDFKESTEQKQVLGDAMLYNMSNFIQYKSREQKVIIQASLNLPVGHTLLACLPTGGGKSLIGQLPAFVATEGGTLSGSIEGAGTTIVVVPTVALALDQEVTARKYFKGDQSDYLGPKAYHAALTQVEKVNIYEGVKSGNIPLLFISPEAIINGPLHKILMDSARNGKIIQLIIDEAHIVVDWGSSFRPEFQLLASFRRQMLKASKGNLKTLLLSATLTDWTTKILKDMYSEENNFVEIRADSLRTEPMFWSDQSTSEQDRINKIVEIIPLLPRPIILYVTSLMKAEAWKLEISKQGYNYVDSFTGETSDSLREIALNKWNNDEIDIMVATSAFGMGVDKPDIRTVIHCCLPDSVNRFYQEVGRGGRDGFPSISILSYVPSLDKDEAFGLVNKKVMKETTYAKRWFGMFNSGSRRTSGDTFWVDTDSRPIHLIDEQTGTPNAKHNESTLLFFQRQKLIDIISTESATSEQRRQVLVHMQEIETLQSQEKLEAWLAPIRKAEQDYVFNEFYKMEILATKNKHCWSKVLSEIYPYAEPRCGGCPGCDRKYEISDSERTTITIFGKEHLRNISRQSSGKIKRFLGYGRELLLYSDSRDVIMNSELWTDMVVELTNSGVSNIAFPMIYKNVWEQCLKQIPYDRICSFYNVDELLDDTGEYFISGIVAIVYSGEMDLDNRLYKWARNYIDLQVNNQVIHIANPQTIIESMGKILIELVDAAYSVKKVLRVSTEEGLLG